jgi:hypothetical protein
MDDDLWDQNHTHGNLNKDYLDVFCIQPSSLKPFIYKMGNIKVGETFEKTRAHTEKQGNNPSPGNSYHRCNHHSGSRNLVLNEASTNSDPYTYSNSYTNSDPYAYPNADPHSNADSNPYAHSARARDCALYCSLSYVYRSNGA